MGLIINSNNQEIELGKVAWLRSYSEALEQSNQTGKPILLFFQEVPGCSTCVNYGQEVLSHPLMVEFIENEFVPLAIHNNKSGEDAEVLNLYNEPSWNNPVSHFIDEKGNDIVPRLANDYSPLGMFNKMVDVLEKLERTMPNYVKLLGEDLKLDNGHLEMTIYETPCFWSGETTMAMRLGVKYTEAGWINGAEVVKVFFDDKKVTLQELDGYAIQEGFYKIGDHGEYRIDKEPQYYLSQSNYKFLPLSLTQRAVINQAIPYNANPNDFLSPKQKLWLSKLEENGSKDAKEYTRGINTSWNRMNSIMKN